MQAIEADDAGAIKAMASTGGEAFSAVLREHHVPDELQRTPLMLAYWWGRLQAAAALVNAGSDYQQRDSKGHNVAWYARRFGKGAAVLQMTQAIEAAERRISMENVIEKSPRPTDPPPKRRQSDV